MAWCPAGDIQLSKPIIVYFTDTYIRHLASVACCFQSYFIYIVFLLYARIYSGIDVSQIKGVMTYEWEVKPSNLFKYHFASASAVRPNIAWHAVFHLSVKEIILLLCHDVTPQDPKCHDNWSCCGDICESWWDSHDRKGCISVYSIMVTQNTFK